MARTDPHFRLRLPADLKQEIEIAAARNERSINAEIVARLRQHKQASLDEMFGVINSQTDLILSVLEEATGSEGLTLKAENIRALRAGFRKRVPAHLLRQVQAEAAALDEQEGREAAPTTPPKRKRAIDLD